MRKIYATLDIICSTLLIALLSGIILISSIQVVLRYVFKTSLTCSVELVLHLFVYMVLIGLGYAIGKKAHIIVDFVITLIPRKLRQIIMIFNEIFIILFMLFLIFYGFQIIEQMMVSGAKTPTMRIPTLYIYMSVPLGATIGLLYSIRNLIQLFKGEGLEIKRETDELIEDVEKM